MVLAFSAGVAHSVPSGFFSFMMSTFLVTDLPPRRSVMAAQHLAALGPEPMPSMRWRSPSNQNFSVAATSFFTCLRASLSRALATM